MIHEGLWSTLRLDHFTPGKNPVPKEYEAELALRSLWTDAENLAPTKISVRSESLLWTALPRLTLVTFVLHEALPTLRELHCELEFYCPPPWLVMFQMGIK